MTLLRCLLGLFVFIGALAGACAMALVLVLLLRFPPLLIPLVFACWILIRVQRQLD